MCIRRYVVGQDRLLATPYFLHITNAACLRFSERGAKAFTHHAWPLGYQGATLQSSRSYAEYLSVELLTWMGLPFTSLLEPLPCANGCLLWKLDLFDLLK